MICIEIEETGEPRRIEREIWVTVNRNGPVITPHRVKARGICDGRDIWSLGSLEGYPKARIITLSEYLECQAKAEKDPDPELTAEEAMHIMMGGSYETE